MTTLTTHPQQTVRPARAKRPFLSALRRLAGILPFAGGRRGYESLIAYYEAAAQRRLQKGDERGARYDASHASAIRESTPEFDDGRHEQASGW